MARPTQYQKLSLQLDAENKKLKAKLAGTKKQMGGLGGEALKLGALMAGAFVIGGLTSFGRGVFDLTKEFGFMMSRVKALTGASDALSKKLSEQAQILGKKTQFTAIQAGEAMTFLAQAGLKTNEILKAMPNTLELAAAGQVSLAEAADISTNVMAAYGLKAENLGRVNDIIANTTTNANSNVLEFAEAFKMVGPLAKASGQSIEDMSASIGLLANAGIKGTMAGTQLRAMLAKLQSPTATANAILKKFGIETMDKATGKMRRMNDILVDMRKAGLSTKDMFKVFDLRAATSATVLTSLSGTFEEFVDTVGTIGTAADIARKQMDNLKGDTLKLTSAWKGLMLAMGTESDGIMRDTIQLLTSFVNVLGRVGGGILGIDVGEAVISNLEKFNNLFGEDKLDQLMKWKDGAAKLKDQMSVLNQTIGEIDELPWYANNRQLEKIAAIKEFNKLNQQLDVLQKTLEEAAPVTSKYGKTTEELAAEADAATQKLQALKDQVFKAAEAEGVLWQQTNAAAVALKDILTPAVVDANKALGELFEGSDFLIPPEMTDPSGIFEFGDAMRGLADIEDARHVKLEEMKLTTLELAEAQRLLASDEVIEGYTGMADIVGRMANGIANARDNWAALASVAIAGAAQIGGAIKNIITVIDALKKAKAAEVLANQAVGVSGAVAAGASAGPPPFNLIAIATGVATVLATIAPFIGSFAKGTDFVPQTGMAMIHKGEKIIPASQNRNGGGQLSAIVSGTDLKFVLDEENRKTNNTF